MILAAALPFQFDNRQSETVLAWPSAPMRAALARDATFTRLALPRQGLDCTAVEHLCAALRGHRCLTALDLSYNRVSDRGGLALARLVSNNRRIVSLNLSGTPLLLFTVGLIRCADGHLPICC
jgi:hypothetical protein